MFAAHQPQYDNFIRLYQRDTENIPRTRNDFRRIIRNEDLRGRSTANIEKVIMLVGVDYSDNQYSECRTIITICKMMGLPVDHVNLDDLLY